MPQERLQKIIAHAGLASRRKAEEMIAAGRVAVDGKVVKQAGVKADPVTARITVDGIELPRAERLQYWLVHKPLGVVSTVRDPQGRKRVVELLPPEAGRVYPVGRLDRDSEGLILLTNDGELANLLMHPRQQVPKHYRVWVEGLLEKPALEKLRQGIALEEGVTASARVHIKGGGRVGRGSGIGRTKLAMVLTEGRKREIRRMCEAVGHPVKRLIRVALGPLKLGDLPLGASRPLTRREINGLKQAAGMKMACKSGSDGVKKTSRRQGGPRRRQR